MEMEQNIGKSGVPSKMSSELAMKTSALKIEPSAEECPVHGTENSLELGEPVTMVAEVELRRSL